MNRARLFGRDDGGELSLPVEYQGQVGSPYGYWHLCAGQPV